MVCDTAVNWRLQQLINVQSKQYLTTHTIDKGARSSQYRTSDPLLTPNEAHPTDIFSLAATPSQLLSASGSSIIRIHSTTDPTFPLVQSLEKAHRLGCHHLVTSSNGKVAASAGFGGEVKIWASDDDGQWYERRKIVGADFHFQRLRFSVERQKRLIRWGRWEQSR